MATQLVIGRGKVYITEWTGADYTVEPSEQALMSGFIGNCPKFELGVEEETKEHQDYTSGLKSIDDEITILGRIVGSMTCDNVTADNIANFFRGEVDGTTVKMLTALEKRYRVRLAEDNPKGSNRIWDLWKVKFTSSGTKMALIGDEYRAMEYNFKTFKCADEHPPPESPYGVSFPSSSTTSTTTSTSTTTTSTTTTTTTT